VAEQSHSQIGVGFTCAGFKEEFEIVELIVKALRLQIVSPLGGLDVFWIGTWQSGSV